MEKGCTPPTIKLTSNVDVAYKNPSSGNGFWRDECAWCERGVFKTLEDHEKDCGKLYVKWARKYPETTAANPPPGARARAALARVAHRAAAP